MPGMDAPQSVCPTHAGEVRDARLAFLDQLIRQGWGSVPMYVIEALSSRTVEFFRRLWARKIFLICAVTNFG